MLNKSNLDSYGDILTAKDVRNILGIGNNKVYELLKSGTIKNFKIGRDRKIPKICLEEYINSMVADSVGDDTYLIEGGSSNDNYSEN